MDNLFTRSIEIILANQHASGAYLASPNFNTYRFSWFRDGAFIAYAMNLVGEHASARRFHNWAVQTILRRTQVVDRVILKTCRGEPLDPADILHTRYTAEGEVADQDWPNFQLDGFGTWLWSLNEHCRLNSVSPEGDWLQAACLVADYLMALWQQPCSDCWEEFPEQVHTYTLAAIYAGLGAWENQIAGNLATVGSRIRQYLNEQAVAGGHFVKHIGTEEVDASLVALATPYQVVDCQDPRMVLTIETVERHLRRGGGVHRYAGDTYYGGGEWVLLTAWLGWYYLQSGMREKAKLILKWVEDQADSNGFLPEQVPATLIDPTSYAPWRARWGEIASPLLWSHAKYLILRSML